jgi:hypothetical protein
MISIKRYESSPYPKADGQFGELQLLGGTFFSLEHQWVYDKDRWPYGRPFYSSVPLGTYDLIERRSTKYNRMMHYLHNPSLGVIGDHSGVDPKLRYDCGIQFLPTINGWEEGSISIGIAIGTINGRSGLIKSSLINEFIYDYVKSFNDTKISIS